MDMGFIFSSPVSFEPSVESENGWFLILSNSPSIRDGAIAKFSIQLALVEAEW